jgi:HK97 family phage major capsid protein
MTEKTTKLREKRAALWGECKKLHELAGEEKRDLTPEESEKWDKLSAEIDSLKAVIDREERCAAIDAEMAERAEGESRKVEKIYRDRTGASAADVRRIRDDRSTPHPQVDETRAFQGWACQQAGLEVSNECREAAQRAGVNLAGEYFEVRLRPDYENLKHELRMHTTANAGGQFIPEGFVASLERALLHYGNMRLACSVIRTEGGEALPWPTSDDTSNSGALLGESAAVTVLDVATSSVTFNAYKYYSRVVKVTAELMQDSAFNMAAVVGAIIGERIGRATNAAFTTGTGSSQPNGIVTASTAGPTYTVAAPAGLPGKLIDLVHSVDPAYRTQGACGWMMHDTSVALIRKIRDSTGASAATGQFMWQPGMVQSEPDRIFGFPVYVNQDMVQTTAGLWSPTDNAVLFGNLKKYMIRDAGPIRVRRLVELYAANDHEGFVAFSRHDGDLLDAGTNPVKYLETA